MGRWLAYSVASLVKMSILRRRAPANDMGCLGVLGLPRLQVQFIHIRSVQERGSSKLMPSGRCSYPGQDGQAARLLSLAGYMIMRQGKQTSQRTISSCLFASIIVSSERSRLPPCFTSHHNPPCPVQFCAASSGQATTNFLPWHRHTSMRALTAHPVLLSTTLHGACTSHAAP